MFCLTNNPIPKNYFLYIYNDKKQKSNCSICFARQEWVCFALLCVTAQSKANPFLSLWQIKQAKYNMIKLLNELNEMKWMCAKMKTAHISQISAFLKFLSWGKNSSLRNQTQKEKKNQFESLRWSKSPTHYFWLFLRVIIFGARLRKQCITIWSKSPL